MKQSTHPNWHNDTQASCVCGNSFATGSVLATISVDICAKCHPFFTKEERFLDREGRVDRFRKMQERAQQIQQSGGGRKSTKKQTSEVLSFKDVLEAQKQDLQQAA